MSKDGCCSGSPFSIFLTGAIMGATAALLLTTKTGKETREILAEYGADFKENLPEDHKAKTDEALDKGREYLDAKKEALNEAIAAGKIAMAEEKEELLSTLDQEKA